MKTKYPIEINDLRHQSDYITSKKFNYCKNTALILTFSILIRHREIELISDGNKFIEVKRNIN